MKVSIQGNKGSYHDIVARSVFGDGVETLERDSFEEVFRDALSGPAEFGIVAIENSIAGSLDGNYDLLLENEVSIAAERYLRVSHQLMALPETDLRDITEVISHPMAIKQCRAFLEQYPNWIIREHPDTAGAAALIARERRRNAAAIASSLAAAVYGMRILKSGIETNRRNYTRFFIISREQKYPAAANKTSIAFMVKHEIGSLAKVLNILAAHQINMTKIESRPIAGAEWEYRFFMDFAGGAAEANVQAALSEIQKRANWFKILGSYVNQPVIE